MHLTRSESNRSTGPLRIRLFGSISVEDGDRRLGVRDFGGVKPKQVLEILLAARGRPVPKDRLADCLWGEALPRNVTGTLESYVSVLRNRLAPGSKRGHALVVTEPEAYRFAIDDAEIDLDEFDELTRLAEAAETTADRRTYLEAAVALVRGEVLEDEPYADWAEPVRSEYHRRVLLVMLDAAYAALEDEDFRAAAAHAESAMAHDRFDEEAVRLAMLAYYALGRQHDALRAHARCRRALDDLGTVPSRDTEALHDAVRSHTGLPAQLLSRSRVRLDEAAAVAAPAPAVDSATVVGEFVLGLFAVLGEVMPDLRVADLRDRLRDAEGANALAAALVPAIAGATGAQPGAERELAAVLAGAASAGRLVAA